MVGKLHSVAFPIRRGDDGGGDQHAVLGTDQGLHGPRASDVGQLDTALGGGGGGCGGGGGGGGGPRGPRGPSPRRGPAGRGGGPGPGGQGGNPEGKSGAPSRAPRRI